MGTPEFAVEALAAMYGAGHDIVGVVTQPDKPNSRRGNEVLFSPVKKAAIKRNLPVYQPAYVSSAESKETLASLNADIIVVCAYGQLLKPNILNLTRYGCINIHASLLPKYRGAAPMHRCIINGEIKTGISIMYMDEGLDTGDVMITSEISIAENMNVGELHDLMSAKGAELIVKAVELLETGEAPRTKQNEADSSYAEKITKAECEVDFDLPNTKVHNLIRGLNPFPGAFTHFNGKIIKLFDTEKSDECYNKSAGTLIGLKNNGIAVACKSGSLLIKSLKPEGKRLMTATEFWAGLHQKDGLFFGKQGD